MYLMICCFVARPVVMPAFLNVTMGTNITFDCDEFGSPPFSYQWYMRSNMTGDDILLVNETNEFYTIPAVMYMDTAVYFCEANNSLGVLSNSTPATLLGKNVTLLNELSYLTIVKLFKLHTVT